MRFSTLFGTFRCSFLLWFILTSRRCQLFNNKDDRVKIVYHPEYLNATSSVLPLDYHQFVRGCHLGVFPSSYEPWGYTPAECTLSGTPSYYFWISFYHSLLGVPSVSSDLTGFAGYISRKVMNPEDHGMLLLPCNSFVISCCRYLHHSKRGQEFWTVTWSTRECNVKLFAEVQKTKNRGLFQFTQLQLLICSWEIELNDCLSCCHGMSWECNTVGLAILLLNGCVSLSFLVLHSHS
jgi:hypothetical protein